MLRQLFSRFIFCVCFGGLILLGGCTQQNPITLADFGKSTIDHVADLHIEQLQAHTLEITRKLYLRNPRELKKEPDNTLQSRLELLRQHTGDYRFAELQQRISTDAINLAFDPNFSGDRVFALAVGLHSMVHYAYSEQRELFYFDRLDPQLLYHCARNFERVNWMLNNTRNAQGQLLLLSNGESNGIRNRSYERLFGKMISLQDMMAVIVADQTNRGIVNIIQNMASSALIPIGV